MLNNAGMVKIVVITSVLIAESCRGMQMLTIITGVTNPFENLSSLVMSVIHYSFLISTQICLFLFYLFV